MAYPLLSEYVEAIKAAEDNFEQLKHLRPVLDEDDQPVMTSGNFAVVFKMKNEQTGKLHAVKCFLRDQEGRDEAYRMIAEELEYVNSTYLTPIKYLDKELFVDTNQTDETEFPVLLMDWVDGVTLDKYIRENIYDEYALSKLAYQFSRLAMWLIPQPFAHGDLKPDNILVRDDGTLVLVDYDGMYVPAMKGQRARELGSPDFRHPSRTETDFDEHIDDFSLATILLSLKAISLQPELLEQYGASDRLLFSEKDYRNVSKCELLKALLPSDDSELNVLTSLFLIALEKKNLSNVSFRLFDLCRPKEPIYVNLSTEVTEEDLADAWTDEYGAKYSKDRKRLLKCNNPFIGEYTIKPCTIVICNEVFREGRFFTKIHIPDSVTEIGDHAFYCCSSLRELHIPNSVTRIEDYAFAGCSSLSELHIPDSVTKIGVWAFFGCKSLSELYIPDTVTEIDKEAFRYCSSLRELHIPNSVIKIGDGAFSECSSLEEIHISDSVTSIGDSAFANCNSLSEIHIPDSVTKIGKHAFEGCSSLLEIHIPDSVTKIESNAFDGCRSLIELHIPDSVTEIEFDAFWYCSSLRELHIPNSVIKIGGGAFYKCSSLRELHIPDSVTMIGKSAFFGCSSLTSIFVDSQNKYYDSRNHCNAVIVTESNKLVVGCASTIIPDSVTSIGESAFFGCTSLDGIHIPNSVTSIGDFAFHDCSSLRELHIPDSVTMIGKSAFSGCSSLTSIFVDTQNKYYDSRNNCNAVIETKCNKLVVGCASTIIPDSVTSIGESAFFGCTSLDGIHIPNSVTSIGDFAFHDCSSLRELHIPDSVTMIGQSAFSGCSSLSEIHIPDSVTRIGGWAFSDCCSLSTIHIPDSVTKIGDGIFSRCSSLSKIVIPSGSRSKFKEMLPEYKDKLVEVDV